MKIRITNYFRLASGCLGVLFAATAMGQQPDTIFYNGKILTTDAEFSIVEAVSMSKGRFTSVGKSSDLLNQAGPNTEKVDLKGKTVIPGLIDNHMHYMRGASRWRFEARIDGVTSRAEALKIIGDKAKEAGPGKWVFVLGGWSEQQFADNAGGFTKEELDSVAPQNPVFLQKSYSRAYMNTLAEQAIGNSSSGSGRMTGGRSSGGGSNQSQGNRSKGNSGKSKGGKSKGSSGARTTINKALAFIPERSEADRVDDIAYFNSYLNRLGLTTVYDVGRGSDGNFDPVKTLAESDNLTMRVYHTLRYQAYNPQEVDGAIQLISSSKPLECDDWFGLIGLGEHIYSPLHDSTMRSSFFDRAIWGQFERLVTAAASGGWHIHEHQSQGNRSKGNSGKSKGGKSKGSSGARTTINKALAFIPERSEADRVDDIAYFNSYLNRLGLTTVYDVGRGSDGNFDPVKTLAESDNLTMRVYHTLRYQAYNPQEVDGAIQLISSSKPLECDDWFGLIGLGEHIYSPLHDSTMRSSFFDRAIWGQFERLVTAAASGGWHIHEHAQQDTTAEGIIDIAERLNGKYPMKDLRWTVAHCDLMSEASINRAKQLGLTLAVHNKTAKPVVEGQDSPPIASMQESGIVWGLGSDGTVVSTINPFHTLWWVTSGKVFPNQVSIKNPVSRKDALIAHTRSNAYMMFKEKDLGTIEAGKLADMVVLDQDYLTIPVDEIRNIKALMTVVGGKKVYSAVR